MPTVRVLVVSHSSAVTGEIIEAFKTSGENIVVTDIYRDYHFSVADADIVVGYGVCKTTGDSDDVRSYPIRFPEAKRAATNWDIPYVSLLGFWGTRLKDKNGYIVLVRPEVAVKRLKRAIAQCQKQMADR